MVLVTPLRTTAAECRVDLYSSKCVLLCALLYVLVAAYVSLLLLKNERTSCLQTTLNASVSAPEFDTSTLIKENALTAIGRVVKPKDQPIGALFSALPRKCSLKGGISGSDLGLHCFQFRFELEEDLLKVLAQRPYHYNHWIVILQRWEPVISPTFPS